MGPGGPAEASVDKPRVLIAEDESEIAEVARSMVEALVPGAVVETVADGRSALRRMLEFRPHLLLADLRLPSCDGYVLCEAVRTSPLLAGTRVIVLTAYGGPEVRAHFRRRGVPCLEKPFAWPEFRRFVLAALSGDGESWTLGEN